MRSSTEPVTTARYQGAQIQRIRPDLAYLEQISRGAAGPAEHDWDAVITRPGARAITASIAGRLAGFVLCQPCDAEAEPDLAAARAGLSAEESRAFTRSALRVHALIVAPAAENLGVSGHLLDAARREQANGRVFAVLPGDHPGNRVARAAGWHEVRRSRSGLQLLLAPGHPALAASLLRD